MTMRLNTHKKHLIRADDFVIFDFLFVRIFTNNVLVNNWQSLTFTETVDVFAFLCVIRLVKDKKMNFNTMFEMRITFSYRL